MNSCGLEAKRSTTKRDTKPTPISALYVVNVVLVNNDTRKQCVGGSSMVGNDSTIPEEDDGQRKRPG
jgi:hypothetical protein